MSTIIDKLEKCNYDPSSELLTEFLTLAKNINHANSTVVSGGYFNILLTASIRGGGTSDAVKSAHRTLYPEVKKICITKDMTPLQRNSATNFARSAYSTIYNAALHGIALVPGITKTTLSGYHKMALAAKAMRPSQTHRGLVLIERAYDTVAQGADLKMLMDRFQELFTKTIYNKLGVL